MERKFELSLVFTLGFLAALAGIALFYLQTPQQTGFSVGKALGLPAQQNYGALAVRPVFSPGSQEELVAFVDSATKTLDVMLYQFSNPAMQYALVRAASRGVDVRVILEPRVDSNYPTAEFLARNGVSVRWASREYTNTHSKTAVADARRVLVGSTNWSRQAVRSNRESSVIVESEPLAGEFERVFEEDWAKASVFVS